MIIFSQFIWNQNPFNFEIFREIKDKLGHSLKYCVNLNRKVTPVPHPFNRFHTNVEAVKLDSKELFLLNSLYYSMTVLIHCHGIVIFYRDSKIIHIVVNIYPHNFSCI
jgi:hypothetical protein